MVSHPVIALISSELDLNLHLIKNILQHRGIPYLHLDPMVFGRNFDISLATNNEGKIYQEDITCDHLKRYKLSDIRAVWSRGANYRGGRSLKLGTYNNLLYNESLYTYEYIWWLLRDRIWVNPIINSRAAANRLIQCSIAADLGIRVPRQIITTFGDDVVDFIKVNDKRIIKSIAQGGYWESGPRRIATEYFCEQDTNDYIRSRFPAPTLLQDYIEKDHELRVAVVGNEVFAAAIDSSRDKLTALDSRRWESVGLTYYRVKISETEKHIFLKINERLGLNYSSMDFIRGVDGHLYFLETNPAGQWSFIEVQTGYPITEKIVDLLMGE